MHDDPSLRRSGAVGKPGIAPTGGPGLSPSPPPLGSAEWLEWQRGQREAALRAQLRASRATVAAITISTAAASVAALDAGAAGASPLPRTHPVAAALPAPARAAGGLPVSHPRIWERDLPSGLPRAMQRHFDVDGFLARSRAHARARSVGGIAPLAPATVRIAELLVWAARKGAGIARVTFEALSTMADMCPDTARRAVRWLEQGGLVTTVNTMGRRDGMLVRTANAYMLNAPAPAPAADAGDAAETIARPRIGARWAEWSKALGMTARSFGFNRFPARPAPA